MVEQLVVALLIELTKGVLTILIRLAREAYTPPLTWTARQLRSWFK